MSRRGENIFKRRDGRWEARYVKEIALDGRKKYGSVYAKTYHEVKAKQQICINQPLGSIGKTSMTIDELMLEWLESVREQLKISSYQKYQAIVKNHISDKLGGLPLKCVTVQLITQFVDSLIKEKHLSAETANQVIIVLEMGFKYARERYRVVLPEVRLLKTSKSSMRVFSSMEQKIFVRKLLEVDDVFTFGILFALYTGLRIGELCALRWEDISDNTIHISKTMQRLKSSLGNIEIIILPPKTASSDRVIPVPKALVTLIEEHRKAGGYMLTQNNGRLVEPRLMQRKFSKLVDECGLDSANFHTLRHTFATRCIEADVDVKTLSEILGHSDVKTTLNKYVHSSFELKQSSMDKLSIEI